MTDALHVETPLFQSRALSAYAGRSIWLKVEAVQPCGSFKIRGVGLACQEYLRRGAKRFITSSGGNAGIAVAYAGRRLAVPVCVVVPETTSERAKELIRLEGGELVVHGSSWNEANALAQAMRTNDAHFVHPFDDPLLWKGHATVIDEVARVGIKPDVIVLSVGGGGLLCGILEGLDRNGWSDIPIVGVETDGAASLAHSMQSGERVTLNQIATVATSLGAKQICQQAFEYATRDVRVRSRVVSDRLAVDACMRFLTDHRLLVEPACGASLAVAYGGDPILSGFNMVMVVVCGGATTSYENLQMWSAQLGVH